MKYFNWFCLFVFVVLFAFGAYLKYHCCCDGFSDRFCYKCGHWAFQCPRFFPRDGFRVPHFPPSCSVSIRPVKLNDCRSCPCLIEGGR